MLFLDAHRLRAISNWPQSPKRKKYKADNERCPCGSVGELGHEAVAVYASIIAPNLLVGLWGSISEICLSP